MMEFVYCVSAGCLLVSMAMVLVASVRLTAARRLFLRHMAEAHAVIPPENDPYRGAHLDVGPALALLPDGKRQVSVTELRYFHALEAIATVNNDPQSKKIALVALGRRES